MPQEDHEATELEHAEEIGFVIFPAADQAAEVMKPGEKAFDFPATAVPAQLAAVLGALAVAIVLVGRDEPNTVFLPEAVVEWIAVVGAAAVHASWFGSREALAARCLAAFALTPRSRGSAP